MDSFTDILFFLSHGFFFYIVVFLFGLLFLITLHEYGHYIVARWYGVKIEQFAIGFGRELWGFTDRENVRWSFCAIPLGGYVKIFGDYDVKNPVRWDPELKTVRPLTPEELKVAFCTRTVWQRMAIVMAGPMINFIPAVFLLAAIFSFYGQISSPLVINGIDINAAAYEAGFRLGDQILEMDGKPLRRFEDVWERTMKEHSHTFRFKVLRDSQILLLEMKPREEKFIDTKGIERSNGRTGMGFFGASFFKDIISVDGISTDKQPDKARELLAQKFDQVVEIGTRYRQDEISLYLMKFPKEFNTHLENPSHKDYDKIYSVDKDKPFMVRMGIWESLHKTFSSVIALPLEVYKRINATAQGKNDDQIIAGIGKMSDMAATYAKAGLYSYVIFLCIFSIQLAMINLLPIPVLDGGYMVFLGYEAVRGKPVPQKVQNWAFIIGMVMLLGIMILANLSDLFHVLR